MVTLVLDSEDSITEIRFDSNYIPIEYRNCTRGEFCCCNDVYLSTHWRDWESSIKISDWLEEADWIELYNDGLETLVNKEAIDFLKDKKII